MKSRNDSAQKVSRSRVCLRSHNGIGIVARKLVNSRREKWLFYDWRGSRRHRHNRLINSNKREGQHKHKVSSGGGSVGIHTFGEEWHLVKKKKHDVFLPIVFWRAECLRR